MEEQLILVDLQDRESGRMEKLAAHKQPALHRAFSIFLVDSQQEKERILIQQRAFEKYHAGGLWANACCSHPRPGEALLDAAKRRLNEDLGIVCDLQEIGHFVYLHRFNDTLFEYEYDHILLGSYSGSVFPDPREIAKTQWLEEAELSNQLLTEPGKFAPWFLTAAPIALEWIKNQK